MEVIQHLDSLWLTFQNKVLSSVLRKHQKSGASQLYRSPVEMIKIHSKESKSQSKIRFQKVLGILKEQSWILLPTFSLTKKNLTRKEQLYRVKRKKTQVLSITATMHGNQLCSLATAAFNEYDTCFQGLGASLMVQLVKNPPAVQETWVRSLGWEDPLEKGIATHSSIMAWRIPQTVQSMGSQTIRHN